MSEEDALRVAAAVRSGRLAQGVEVAGCRPPADAGDGHVYHRFVVAVDRALGLDGYPEAERAWAQCLSLPCYPLLTDGEADTVVAALGEALSA